MTAPAVTTSAAEGTPTPVTPGNAELIQRIKDLVASDAAKLALLTTVDKMESADVSEAYIKTSDTPTSGTQDSRARRSQSLTIPPTTTEELYKYFKDTIPNLSDKSINILRNNGYGTIEDMTITTTDKLTAIKVPQSPAIKLLALVDHINSTGLYPIDATNIVLPKHLFPSQDKARSYTSDDDRAVTLRLAKLMTLTKLPTSWGDWAGWKDQCRTVIGNNGWNPTINGNTPLATNKERYVNNQFYYQLKGATKELLYPISSKGSNPIKTPTMKLMDV